MCCLLCFQITVSTVGLVPEIKRFAVESKARLAVSVHATTDEIRDWVAPINRKYKLTTLIATLEEYYPVEKTHANFGSFVVIEYVFSNFFRCPKPSQGKLYSH
jgi:23S rRNA (adenine2503-C2)-methyltransferase